MLSRRVKAVFCHVLAALVEYKNISKKTLQESIESEMSGNLEELLVAVGEKKNPFTLNKGSIFTEQYNREPLEQMVCFSP